MKRITLIIASVLLLASSCQKQESFDELYSRVFSIASSHVENMYHSLPEGRMPRTTGPDGSFKTDGINWWCSGFFPGTLWYVYEGTGNYTYDQYARQYTQMLATLKTTAPPHDIGFQIIFAFVFLFAGVIVFAVGAGIVIVCVQWAMVLFGIFYKSLAKRSIPKLSLTIYLIMGWTIIFFLPLFIKNANLIFMILIGAGGLLYTAGAAVYAKKNFKYHHMVWHLFIDLAAICHFIGIVFWIY